MTASPPAGAPLRAGPRLARFVLAGLLAAGPAAPGLAQAPPAAQAAAAADGRRDFDFELGTWKTDLRRLLRPLTGSTTWAEYSGTSVVRKVWDGRANLVELDVTGPSGRIEGLSLRLYNPDARQWSLHFANSTGGTLFPPVIGQFRDGRGEFYGQELLDGRAIFVRFVIMPITPDSIRFEQAFSGDGGRTWELNWVAIDTRIREPSGKVP